MGQKKLSDREKEAKAVARAAERLAQKDWRTAARKLGPACRGSFVRVIKAATLDKSAPLVWGDDRAALLIFEAALRGGEIVVRKVTGISGEVQIFEMKKI